jgi:hypothetical protein
MGFIALAVLHKDSSSLAAILIKVIAWGGIIKTTALMIFPRSVVAKARLLGQAGFIHVVWFICLLVGGYFAWFGYFSDVSN